MGNQSIKRPVNRRNSLLVIILALFVASIYYLAGCGTSFNHRKPTYSVYGQTSNSTVVQSLGLINPRPMIHAGGKYIISDTGNNRVLIFNSLPSYPLNPDVVLGQINSTYTGPNYGGISASSLSSPYKVMYDGTRLFVADSANSRVLIWNRMPTSNFQAADVIVGQPNGTSNTSGTTQTLFNNPKGMWSNGTSLYVSDSRNNRIMVYPTIPTSSGAAATYVLGQPDFVTRTGGTTANNLSSPQDVYLQGNILMVADFNNNRVVIWQNAITSSNQTADYAWGQADLISSTSSASSPTTSSISFPTGIYGDGTRVVVTTVYIADTYNNRIVIAPLDLY